VYDNAIIQKVFCLNESGHFLEKNHRVITLLIFSSSILCELAHHQNILKLCSKLTADNKDSSRLIECPAFNNFLMFEPKYLCPNLSYKKMLLEFEF